jgi:quercetin dioxygenase-like cupin family protein
MDLQSPVNWEEMEWESVRPGVKRKVFQAEGGTLVLNHLEPGHKPNPHSHAHEQIVFIVQGETELTVGSKVFNLGPGSLMIVPPHAEHFAKVTGKDTLVNLDFFIPRREDYRQSKIVRKG